MIVVIDYKMGNIGSILNMLKKTGAEAIVSDKAEDIKRADKLILPGVGSFDEGIKNLKESGLIPVIEEKVLKDKTPILGICLGMQLFSESSEEGVSSGLKWIKGKAKKFKSDNLKIPHMGWNTISPLRDDVLFQDMPEDFRFYFVHSYYMECGDKEDVLAVTNYGGDFCSVVKKENIIGVQFHPEKSHKFGMQLLKNFSTLC